MWTEELEVKVAHRLNENINIPIISESTEYKVISAILDVLKETVEEIIVK